MTADGKIADLWRSPARFSSAADKAHLEKQIASVDGVLFGAGTLRAYGRTLPISNPQLLQLRKQQHQLPQPVQIVCSASAEIDSQLPFFSQPVPRWLITTTAGAKAWQGMGEGSFERILVADGEERGRGGELSRVGFLDLRLRWAEEAEGAEGAGEEKPIFSLKNLSLSPCLPLSPSPSVTHWKRVLKDTRFVLEQLKSEEI